MSQPLRVQEEVVKSVAIGDYAPLFYLKTDEGISVTSLSGISSTGESRSLIALLESKPLVLSFYCSCWGRYAPLHFNMLQEINLQIEAMGGQLLILTNESAKSIERLTKKLDKELTSYTTGIITWPDPMACTARHRRSETVLQEYRKRFLRLLCS